VPGAAFSQAAGTLPFSLRNNRKLEGWIRLESDESVTVFIGKAELGQGILTALAQIAAEELDVGFNKIRMVSADTSRSPDEQYTYTAVRRHWPTPSLMRPAAGYESSLWRPIA
jgi:nicotinate dehydrogenase subunit B